VEAGGFLEPLWVVLLSVQLSHQGLTTTVRDITAMRMTAIMMVLHTPTEVVPTIMVAAPTITSEAILTDIGLNINRAHSQRAALTTVRPLLRRRKERGISQRIEAGFRGKAASKFQLLTQSGHRALRVRCFVI